jgi:hypothetical protein
LRRAEVTFEQAADKRIRHVAAADKTDIHLLFSKILKQFSHGLTPMNTDISSLPGRTARTRCNHPTKFSQHFIRVLPC